MFSSQFNLKFQIFNVRLDVPATKRLPGWESGLLYLLLSKLLNLQFGAGILRANQSDVMMDHWLILAAHSSQ